MTQNPEWLNNNSDNLFDDFETSEFDEVTEAIHHFDLASNEVYLQITRIMLGGGGDTSDEAKEILDNLQSTAAARFGVACELIFDSSGSSDIAATEIASLYMRDEERRIHIFTQTMPDEKFEVFGHQEVLGIVNIAIGNIQDELSRGEDVENPTDSLAATYELSVQAKHFAKLFDDSAEQDLAQMLDAAPHNKAELYAVRQAVRRDRMVAAFSQIGTMVGTCVLTVLAMSLLDKRKK